MAVLSLMVPVHALRAQQMPHHLAVRCASYNDNLIALDVTQSNIVGRLIERVRRIKISPKAWQQAGVARAKHVHGL
jgi:hypothetical protein